MELHTLAYIYHWGRDTIFNLGRHERKKWVDMIKNQKDHENAEINK